MSYILDALRKSEKRRPPGLVPDLFTEHGPRPPRSLRRHLLLLGMAALLGSATGLGVWIGSRVERRAVVHDPVGVAGDQKMTATVWRAASSQEAPAVPRTIQQVPVPARDSKHEDVTVPDESPAEIRVSPPVPTPTLTPEPALIPAPAPLIASETDGDVPAEGQRERMADEPEPMLENTVGIDHAQATRALPRPPLVPPPDGRIVELSELPASLRKEIGEVTLSGHVWSEDPSLRMVTIQDRLLREGGDVAPDLRLENITPNGAIFGYKGYHFRIEGGPR